MTRAVPRPFAGVPADGASHVGADGGAKRRLSGRIAIRCDLRPIAFDDLALPPLHGTKRLRVGSGKAIANHVVRVVDVLPEVVPQSAGEGLPTRIEEIRPGIRSPEDGVRDHDAR